MTKQPTASQPTNAGRHDNNHLPTSPDKKKQKKKHNNLSDKDLIKPKNLFIEILTQPLATKPLLAVLETLLP